MLVAGCGDMEAFTRAKIGTETYLGEQFRAIAAEALRQNHAEIFFSWRKAV